MNETEDARSAARAAPLSDDWMRARMMDAQRALVERRLDTLKSWIDPHCRIVFPGIELEGHAGVDTLNEWVEEVFDGCPTKTYDRWICSADAVAVFGTLQGRYRGGPRIDGTRYIDAFYFDPGGRVTEWLVYNDLALRFPAQHVTG